MPDWKTFIIDASWVSGIENGREYWMNAWMSPTVIAPLATRRPPTTATSTYWMLPMNIVSGCIRLDMNWAPNDDSYRSSFVVAEALLDLALATERLHDRVAGEGLLDLRVEQARALPLGDELGARPGATARMPQTDTGTVVSATTASSGEIVNIMTAIPIEQQHRREHLAQRLLEALGDVVDVVGDPAQQVAARLLVDVAERAAR